MDPTVIPHSRPRTSISIVTVTMHKEIEDFVSKKMGPSGSAQERAQWTAKERKRASQATTLQDIATLTNKVSVVLFFAPLILLLTSLPLLVNLINSEPNLLLL